MKTATIVVWLLVFAAIAFEVISAQLPDDSGDLEETTTRRPRTRTPTSRNPRRRTTSSLNAEPEVDEEEKTARTRSRANRSTPGLRSSTTTRADRSDRRALLTTTRRVVGSTTIKGTTRAVTATTRKTTVATTKAGKTSTVESTTAATTTTVAATTTTTTTVPPTTTTKRALIAPPGGAGMDCGVSKSMTLSVRSQTRLTTMKTKISGGFNATNGDWPWQAFLLITSSLTGLRYICGGTLIDASWVLTAAHCCSITDRPQEILVHLGSNFLGGPWASTIAAISMIKHPNYNPRFNHDHDYCLLKIPPQNLTNPNMLIRPVCVPEACELTTNVAQTGERTTVIGWGHVSSLPNSSLSWWLLEVKIPIYDFRRCQTKFVLNPQTMLCAGGVDGEGACQGDSGGPLLYLDTTQNRYYINGIASFGHGCALADTPSVFARVCTVRPWINSYVWPS